MAKKQWKKLKNINVGIDADEADSMRKSIDESVARIRAGKQRISLGDPKGAGKYQREARRYAAPHTNAWLKSGKSRSRANFHLLDMRDPGYGYKGGWCDRSSLLLIAPFRLLCLFVERELYNKYNVQIDWDCTPGHRKAKIEIDLLYLYWRRDRPRLLKAMSRLLRGLEKPIFEFEDVPDEPHLKRMKAPSTKNAGIFAIHRKMEEQLAAEDEKALKRLYAIRNALWT
jgi:hypothetical protein